MAASLLSLDIVPSEVLAIWFEDISNGSNDALDSLRKCAIPAADTDSDVESPGRLLAQAYWAICLSQGLGVVAESKAFANELGVRIHRHLHDRAASGCKYAQFCLGAFEDLGISKTADPAESVRWYTLSANQDYAEAQKNLGNCYYTGRGVAAANYASAAHCFSLAAHQGNALAQYNLALCYYKGHGVAKNYEEAVRWYRLAAEQGGADAQNSTGVCYQNGIGVTKDYGEALRWYRLAAEQGNADAQYNIGFCYDHGLGVQIDSTVATSWYQLAAEQGNALAQNNLGCCYKTGRGGVNKDYARAVHWLCKAVGQGNADAQFNLGLCYQHGQGVWTDYAEAVRLYRLAASQGHPAANNYIRLIEHELLEKPLGLWGNIALIWKR